MLNKIPEKRMHQVRWFLAIGWIVLIISMFFDPVSAILTDPNSWWSPFRLDPNKLTASFQNGNLSLTPYAMGARIFWGIIVPLSILTMLILGHEAWRRICPLSFFSQIPRALGIQRKRNVPNSSRKELARVNPDSWLGKNGLYFQFGLLFIGLNIRLLLVNSDRLSLGIFLILTILASIVVGYLYAGKTWCHYFCPMAPVQMVYTGPSSLLGSKAHTGGQTITQSMCRTVDKTTKNEKSACVSCQSPCFDIDAERSYWDNINGDDKKLLYYGYVGLVIGFFLYFGFYTGNWNYLRSGVWNENQLSNLFTAGFYINGFSIPIPKIIAAPLTLGVFTAITYGLGLNVEKLYIKLAKTYYPQMTQEEIQHQLFSVSAFLAFNLLFFLGVYPAIGWLHIGLQNVVSWLAVISSTLWLYRCLQRNPQVYNKESLTASLRRQLQKLGIDFTSMLEGRTLDQLKTDEVYILAKTMPGVGRERRLELYKNMIQEALAAGTVNSSSSLEVFKSMRQQLEINDEEHYNILSVLGVEDPELLNPHHQLNRENQLRLESYRQAIELLLLELIESGTPLRIAMQQKQRQIISLKQEYCITPDEEAEILGMMLNENSTLIKGAQALISQLNILTFRDQALSSAKSLPPSLRNLLKATVFQQQNLVITQILKILEILGNASEALKIASDLEGIVGSVLQSILKDQSDTGKWNDRLSPEIMTKLHAIADPTLTPPQAIDKLQEISALTELLQDPDPITIAASLSALNYLDPNMARSQANTLLDQGVTGLVQEVALTVLGRNTLPTIASVMTLITKISCQGEEITKVFEQPTIRIGRSQDNDIILADQRVSRNHALILFNSNGAKIQDLGSANSLRVGNKLVKNQQVSLKMGDRIYLGTVDGPVIEVSWEKRTLEDLSIPETMDSLKKLLWLFESPFFKSTNLDTLLELAHGAQIKIYTSGDIIISEGSRVEHFLLLVQGSAIVRHNQEVLGNIKPGQSIGELQLLSSTPYNATVNANSKTTLVLSISQERFNQTLERDRQLTKQLLITLSQQVLS